MTKTWKLMALCVALAVLFVYSVPVPALTGITGVKSSLAIPQTDDDDDDMSGGALAVLLLAVGGAAAGAGTLTLASNTGPGTNTSLNLTAGTTARVSLAGTDSSGKPKRSGWTASMDRTSGNISLIREGTDGRWTGKADGKYYPVTGDSSADELSLTKVDGQTLGFSARKAGRVTFTGRIVMTPNGKSVTITKHKTDSAGRRNNKQITFKAK